MASVAVARVDDATRLPDPLGDGVATDPVATAQLLDRDAAIPVPRDILTDINSRLSQRPFGLSVIKRMGGRQPTE